MHTAFAEFVRDAEASIHDPDAIAERLRSLLAEDGWLAPEHQAPGTDSYRQHLLHVSSCRGLSVVALVWRPGQATPIHDHVSWCVVGVYRGLERETRYRLVGAELERTGTIEAEPGHVEALDPARREHPLRRGRRRRPHDLDPRLRRRHRAPRLERLPALRRSRAGKLSA